MFGNDTSIATTGYDWVSGVTCPTDLAGVFPLLESDMFEPFMLLYRVTSVTVLLIDFNAILGRVMYEITPTPKLNKGFYRHYGCWVLYIGSIIR